MAEPLALAALMIEAAVGWPDALYRRIGHPVGLFARVIDGCERRWNNLARSGAVRRAAGVATMVALLLIAGGGAWLIERGPRMLLGGWAWPVVVLLAVPGLAQRSLHDHVAPVADALAAGDVAAGRGAVGRIVGRDTATLDGAGIARAGIESLSESFCDGVVAPLFWLLLAGLPGIWAYKALNTADSLIGHRETRWRAFGWAAARADDVANWVPARIAGALLCCAAFRGWKTMMRDARKHPSPNAGWPEAAMAGALGVRLAGPVAYDGVTHPKPWIGDGRTETNAADIVRALGLYRRACLLLWLIAGGCTWAL
jgi:adenosylcobinamide-phosphate synthase